MKVVRIDAVRCTIGEAPVWDNIVRGLFLLDIPKQKLLRFDPESEEVRTWDTPGAATALALAEHNEAVLAIRDSVYLLDLKTGASTLVAKVAGQPDNATLNDGRTDRQGRFIIGSCCTEFEAPTAVGGIYGLAGKTCSRLANDIIFSNGTCFSPDGATLYFADGARQTIYAFPYEISTGSIGERKTFASTTNLGGMPDGATVDADGRLWVAINPGGKVAAFNLDGTIHRIINLPTKRPGSVAFGGRDLERLFVTTLDPSCFGEPPEDNAGYLYVVEGLDVRGLPEPRYVP